MQKLTHILILAFLIVLIPHRAESTSCSPFQARTFLNCVGGQCTIAERVFDESGPQMCARIPVFLSPTKPSAIDENVLALISAKIPNANGFYKVVVASKMPPFGYDTSGLRYKEEWEKGHLSGYREPQIEQLQLAKVVNELAALREEASRKKLWFSISPILKYGSLLALLIVWVFTPVFYFRNLVRVVSGQAHSRRVGATSLLALSALAPCLGIFLSVDPIIGLGLLALTGCLNIVEAVAAIIAELVMKRRAAHA